ncbi:MAG: ABC transporter permease [Chloroflexota bacterium]
MRTLDFVLKEVVRRKAKALAGISCILLGIGVFVAGHTTNQALYEKAREQLVRFGANIALQPSEEAFNIYSASFEGSATLPEMYAEEIRDIEHGDMLMAVSPKLYERFNVHDTNLLVVGVTDEERAAKPWWMVDGMVLTDQFPQENEVLLGHYAATHVGHSSAITLGGVNFEVTAVLDETGSSDDFAAYVPLEALQRLTGKEGMVNVIEVSTGCIACPEMNVYDVAREIDEALPGDAKAVPVKQIAEAQMGALGKVQDFIRIIYVVLMSMGAFLMMNYMSSSVSDRRREIGVLLAIGMDASTIYRLFLSKSVVLGIVGGLTGYVVGTLVAMAAGPQMAEASVSPAPELLPVALGLSVGICALASILPARRTIRLDPVEALREV